MQTMVTVPAHPLYRYRLSGMKGGSERYGNCELCDNPVYRTYLQVEQRHYIRASDRTQGWTEHKCNSLFGHLECLLSVRR